MTAQNNSQDDRQYSERPRCERSETQGDNNNNRDNTPPPPPDTD